MTNTVQNAILTIKVPFNIFGLLNGILSLETAFWTVFVALRDMDFLWWEKSCIRFECSLFGI